MAQVTGRVFISMNGQPIRSKEGAMLDMGGVKRDSQISDAGVDGYSETPVAAKVECKVNDTGELTAQDFRDFRDGTIVFQTDTGKVYTVTPAWITEPPSMTKGEWSLKFEGADCLEG